MRPARPSLRGSLLLFPHPLNLEESQQKEAGAAGAPLRFDPPMVTFADSSPGTPSLRKVKVINDGALPIDVSSVSVGAPFTATVGDDKHVDAGDVIAINLTFAPTDEGTFNRTLIVTDTAGRHASVLVAGTSRQRSTLAPSPTMIDGPTDGPQQAPVSVVANETCGTPIKSSTEAGKKNSIGGALGSVAAAWNAVLTEQQGGVATVQGLARDTAPSETSGWQSVLHDVVAEGLVFAMGAVGGYLGQKLYGAVSDVVGRLLPALPVDEAWDAAELVARVHALTKRSHALLVNDVTRSIGAQASASVQQAIVAAMGSKQGSVVVREAFFAAQARALTLAATDATVSVNNLEGDYEALEQERPGLGFAALEAYRNQLMCQAQEARAIQTTKTLAMWAAYLARLELGTHKAEDYEGDVTDGTDLDKNLYNRKNSKREWADELARGVLDIRVVWDYDQKAVKPILRVVHARVRGIGASLKAMLTTAPIREFPMPLLVHGEVNSQSPLHGSVATSELRVGRNEGGSIFYTAESKKQDDDGKEAHSMSERMLEHLGDGQSWVGAEKLLAHVDELRLAKVE
jgi:hypothetical protein